MQRQVSACMTCSDTATEWFADSLAAVVVQVNFKTAESNSGNLGLMHALAPEVVNLDRVSCPIIG